MFFRLAATIHNEYDENWQITEVKKLLMDTALLRRALSKFGDSIPEAKWHLNRFLEQDDRERSLQTNAILSTLSVIEPKEIKASFGYFKPGWTPKEAIEKGLFVIVNGARMVNYRMSMSYVFMQRFSLILQEVRRRMPSNPNDLPVSLVLVELKELEKIPGFASIVAELSPIYRSRKLQLYLVVQALNQLSEELRKQIWSLGNIVCFALQDKLDAEAMAYQLFKYDPRSIKQEARNPNQNPITEPEHGLDRLAADWIQTLHFRECLIRRHISEQQLDSNVYHVSQTRPLPAHPPLNPVWEIRARLLRERGVKVRDALEIINQREIPQERRGPPSV
jgi:hypothetical protein